MVLSDDFRMVAKREKVRRGHDRSRSRGQDVETFGGPLAFGCWELGGMGGKCSIGFLPEQ